MRALPAAVLAHAPPRALAPLLAGAFAPARLSALGGVAGQYDDCPWFVRTAGVLIDGSGASMSSLRGRDLVIGGGPDGGRGRGAVPLAAELKAEYVAERRHATRRSSGGRSRCCSRSRACGPGSRSRPG